jgi:probable F420-dependent oxidoreductase
MRMKFGLAFASSIGIDGSTALDICRRAEAAGFESLWGGEHVILPSTIESKYPYTADGKIPAEPDTPIPDPLIWLAFAAAAAPTLRLGTCILIVPQRNPVILAKELATLDQLSGGRVELGLGVGWLKEEFDALGVPWERRGARNDEYIAAMRALWAGPHAEFHGEFVDFEPVTCSPRPVQSSIPILVGGDTEAAIQRAVRLADGYFPGEGDVERLGGLIHRVREGAERAGRDPDSIEINAMFGYQMADPIAGAEQLAAIGVGRAMVPAFFFAGPGGLDRLSEFGERVIPASGN